MLMSVANKVVRICARNSLVSYCIVGQRTLPHNPGRPGFRRAGLLHIVSLACFDEREVTPGKATDFNSLNLSGPLE